jgi:hypothetical protein
MGRDRSNNMPRKSTTMPQTLASIDPLAIATQHIQACNAEINGYWDDTDRFHETICFSQTPTPALINSSFGVTPDHIGGTPWLNLKYSLNINGSDNAIGELILILNDNLEIIDENWVIDLHSPHVIAH